MSDDVVKQGVAKGTSMGAAVLLVTIGVLEFLQGISAIAKDDVIVVGLEYVYKFNVTTWGWIHLVLGVIIALVGAVLFTGAAWARVAAMAICSLSMLVNFLWLPYYPMWAICLVALNTVVIWAVATWNPRAA
ncbi:hypothetical protein RHDE110596_02425 [Prescottella defluvii]|uniref:DUF7144 family membrane protein n=1 Tax=Prescottella defluvii TaxID=1323361 RepID=UPI0004F29470|nr:hypothetical protein [Prescottella defluvii]